MAPHFSAHIFPGFYSTVRDDEHAARIEKFLSLAGREDLIPLFRTTWRSWRKSILCDMSTSLVAFLNHYKVEEWEVFWDTGTGFNENQKLRLVPNWLNDYMINISLKLPSNIKQFRIDFPSQSQYTILKPDFTIQDQNESAKSTSQKWRLSTHQLKRINNDLYTTNDYNDPFMYWTIQTPESPNDSVQIGFNAYIFPTLCSLIFDQDLVRDVEKMIFDLGDLNTSKRFGKICEAWKEKIVTSTGVK